MYRQGLVACIPVYQTTLSQLCVETQKSLHAIPYFAVGGGILSQLIYPAGDSGAKFSALCDASALFAYNVGHEELVPGIFMIKLLVDATVSLSKTAKFMVTVKKERNAKRRR